MRPAIIAFAAAVYTLLGVAAFHEFDRATQCYHGKRMAAGSVIVGVLWPIIGVGVGVNVVLGGGPGEYACGAKQKAKE